MTTFHPDSLRDPAYRRRIHDLLGKIREVRQAHTYVAYASNRRLLQEFEEVYQENQTRFQEDYQAHLQAYQQLIGEIALHKSSLSPLHYRELTARYAEIEASLASTSYDENRKAGTQIQELRDLFLQYQRAFQERTQGLAKIRDEMKTLMTRVWAEDYARLKSSYQVLKASGEPPATFPDPEAVRIFTESRTADLSALKQKLKGHKRLLRQAENLEGQYYHRSDFLALREKLLRRLRLRKAALWATGVLALGIAAAFWVLYPQVRKVYLEQEVWEQSRTLDTWEAYEGYLEQYPQGKFAGKARQAMLLLPYGRLKGFTGPGERNFDYEGELEAGVPFGQGSATYANGDHYDGAWRNGAPFGHGAMTYADGSTFTGEWQAGVRHGSGTFTSVANDIYTGGWQYNKRHGEGTLLYADGSKYLGQWENDYPEGQGTFIAGESEGFSREGWQAGSNYTGHWHEGLRHGTGTYKWPDGHLYQGKWSQGQPSGKGTLLWPDGSSFSGEWTGGKIDGPGVYRSRLREEQRGIWKGSPEDIRLYDEAGNLLKRGRWENGLFIGE